MKKTTLVILAAGIGSRFGGIKQLAPVGPSGEIIMDYSIYDALEAGFNKIVFIIRKKISVVSSVTVSQTSQKSNMSFRTFVISRMDSLSRKAAKSRGEPDRLCSAAKK